MAGFDKPELFAGQCYKELKQQCIRSGKLFVDPKFPPNYNSLFKGGKQKVWNVEWKRPGELSKRPKLYVEGSSSGNTHQGPLGNCWFVAATSCLATYKTLLQKIIPELEEQEWNASKQYNYQGIFHFKLWRCGEWVDVVVDDLLPTVNNKTVFTSTLNKGEYWSLLLEKAYAKLFGCYEVLSGGSIEQALVDFTGGVSEIIELQSNEYKDNKENQAKLFELLKKALNNKYLMTAEVTAGKPEEMEVKTETGLVKGHGYIITDIRRINVVRTELARLFNQQKEINMIRCRNPWGKPEWKGRFSERSIEWLKDSESERRRMGLILEDPGDFWMHFDDFCKYIVDVTVTRLVDKSTSITKRTWAEATLNSAWIGPRLAGGCKNFKNTFMNNPQLAFTLTKDDEVLISLEQKPSKQDKPKEVIGFHVFKVESNRNTRMHQPLPIIFSSKFTNSRGVFTRLALTKGRYVVLPCTFQPGMESDFYLRVYAEEIMEERHLTRDSQSNKDTVGGVRVKFIRATNLERPEGARGAKPYLIIKCENERATIFAPENTLDPVWKVPESVLFFKTNINSPLEIEIFHKNVGTYQFLGRATIETAKECEDETRIVSLRQGCSNSAELRGRLVITVTSRHGDKKF